MISAILICWLQTVHCKQGRIGVTKKVTARAMKNRKYKVTPEEFRESYINCLGSPKDMIDYMQTNFGVSISKQAIIVRKKRMAKHIDAEVMKRRIDMYLSVLDKIVFSNESTIADRNRAIQTLLSFVKDTPLNKYQQLPEEDKVKPIILDITDVENIKKDGIVASLDSVTKKTGV